MHANRLFEYQGHYLIERPDTPNLSIYWCLPGTRQVRRRSSGTSDLEAAKQRLIEFVHRKRQPENQRPAEVRVENALSMYLEKTMRGKASEDSAVRSAATLQRFFGREGVSLVSEITFDIVDEYIAWRQSKRTHRGLPPANSTINRELGVLRAALHDHAKRGFLAVAPHVKGLEEPPARQRFLSEDECQRLLAACETRHLYLFVLTALHTLQRPGAILRLRCDQVDLQANRIDFLPASEVQTKKRRPVVPISETLRPALEDAIARTRRGFVIEYCGQPMFDIGKSLDQACHRAGIERIVPYTLRHTGATLLAGRGVPFWQISGMMGHSQARTTELYAKHSPEFMGDAMAAVDGMFSAPECGGTDA